MTSRTSRLKLVLVLTENWTMLSGTDLQGLVRMAREAEDSGFDAVMLSEHVILGPDAGAAGLMENPRDWAYPGNQDPSTPWPSSPVLLGAIAAVTTRLRLIAGAVIPPLRHPLLLAKELATIDQLSSGRLVVIPTVSWSRDEYAALGIPFGERGSLLDEQLAVWEQVYARTPASFDGAHYRFRDVYLEPKAYRPGGPLLWFGGRRLHPALLRRLVRYGHGFNPLGRPQPGELQALRAALAAAGRDPDEMEMVGGIRGRFPSPDAVADLGQAMESLPGQWKQGFTTICIKPSMFIDDPRDLPGFCAKALRQATSLIG
ncbi:MAG TPA: TIGR03619 family F420-dependent LLM class oxidoreductase [Streptosporangiaceae bacterium]|nr:TIGR03619 family F420-dependent LLM class oxidoreductase [Streptosporangiaceae bacterium]